jgi:small subunit ribosomal protein S6
MRNFEVTFIVDPVLSGDEVKSTAQTYQDMLRNEGATIVHVDEMGLRQLAYPINKRSTGVYFCFEFAAETGALISKVELALKRDERIMRYLTVSLDKFGVKYNEDKRSGKIGKRTRKEKPKEAIPSGYSMVPPPVQVPIAVATEEAPTTDPVL